MVYVSQNFWILLIDLDESTESLLDLGGVRHKGAWFWFRLLCGMQKRSTGKTGQTMAWQFSLTYLQSMCGMHVTPHRAQSSPGLGTFSDIWASKAWRTSSSKPSVRIFWSILTQKSPWWNALVLLIGMRRNLSCIDPNLASTLEFSSSSEKLPSTSKATNWYCAILHSDIVLRRSHLMCIDSIILLNEFVRPLNCWLHFARIRYNENTT